MFFRETLKKAFPARRAGEEIFPARFRGREDEKAMKSRFGKTKTVLAVTAAWMLAVATVFAGDINANEQTVLDAANATFDYNGTPYVATDAAKDRIRNYLLQDGVDLTAEQASKAISEAFGNLETGIAQGYLVPAGQPAPAEEPSVTPEEEMPEEKKEDLQPETAAETGTDPDSAAPAVSGGEETQPDGVTGQDEPGVLPDKMTKEEEDALIASILEREGLEAEEASAEDETPETENGEEQPAENVEKLPGTVNAAAVAAAAAVIVLAVAGMILYRHKNRFKGK